MRSEGKYEKLWSMGFWAYFWVTVLTLVLLPIAFGEADFANGRWALMLWQLVPIVCGAFFWLLDKRWYATWWLVPMATLAIAADLEIFIHPSSSTVGLLGLFIPLWSLLVIGPISLAIGRAVLFVADRFRIMGR
jgi:hypothetical protein